MLYIAAVFNAVAAPVNDAQLTSLKEKVAAAIVKFEQTPKEDWAFQVSRYEDEEGDVTSSIEQFSPQLTNQWLLKQINGEKPTEKQSTDFVQKKQKQSKAMKEGENTQLKLRKLVNQESLSLISTNERHIVMSFNVDLEKLGKDSQGKLQGKLTYHKQDKFIEEIFIWNKAEFSPMLTANITDLAITFSFVHIDGAILPQQNEMKMKGSFAYFTEIDESSVDRFSDYHYQGKLTH